MTVQELAVSWWISWDFMLLDLFWYVDFTVYLRCSDGVFFCARGVVVPCFGISMSRVAPHSGSGCVFWLGCGGKIHGEILVSVLLPGEETFWSYDRAVCVG